MAMFIQEISLTDDQVCLHHENGSDYKLTLDDAINLFIWLRHHMQEIEERNLTSHLATSNSDEHLHEG
jgi:hypothetical protein